MFSKSPPNFQDEGRESRSLRLQVKLMDARAEQMLTLLAENRYFKLACRAAGRMFVNVVGSA